MEHSIFICLLLLAVAATIHTSIAEPCVNENCQTSEKCDGIYAQGVCNNPIDVCCQLVRPQYRTKCRQFGGECMVDCNPRVQENSARDCAIGTKCCILVN